jgi:hypothetical protein
VIHHQSKKNVKKNESENNHTKSKLKKKKKKKKKKKNLVAGKTQARPTLTAGSLPDPAVSHPRLGKKTCNR